ncbi:hypothetical protein QVD17_09383 [Tagetes erecta]|uniref:AMP-dependent synthetase/ligase domain-containing protein n=1 Tax=Tagetes erecta TaxID=13708 RepID=A0AAD8L4J3_TARER|nr:hypothetical protein QVD17_09383 [Tagetes erecta]
MNHLKPTSANSCPLTPLTFLQRSVTVYGDCTSIVYNGTTFTWADTGRRCLQAASALVGLGICRGDVVSVLAHNVPAMYELQFAVPMSGAVLNNLNTRLDARTIFVMLQHSESRMLFVDVHLRVLALAAVARFPPGVRRPVLVLIRDVGEDNDGDKEKLAESPKNEVEFVMTYEDLVNKGDPNFEWVRPETEWDPITLNYTSGTTSSPKGVVHSHRAIFIVTLDSLLDWSVPKNPVYLWTLPMFHSNGWSFTWGMAAVGGVNICLHKFTADDIFSALDRHNVTHMCGAPVVLNMIANSPNAKALKNPVHFLTDRLKDVIITGGENVSSVEVESVLYSHPAVHEAAVVARPDEFWGETPCAFVSLIGKTNSEDVIKFCRDRLAHYMVPKTVVFLAELPKTATGKIKKFWLRDMAKKLGSPKERSRI